MYNIHNGFIFHRKIQPLFVALELDGILKNLNPLRKRYTNRHDALKKRPDFNKLAKPMNQTLPKKIVEKIQKWNGFSEFNGMDVEYNSRDEEIFEGCEVSVLMEAIRKGNIEIVGALCKAGANVNRIAKETDQTPLISFEEESKNSPEIAKILIDYGADVNYLRPFDLEDDTFNYLFSSPLTDAINAGNFERIELLIDSGAKVNLCLIENGYCAITQLHPKHDDYLQILKLLIENGANVNADNSSALKMAIEIGNIKAIQLLLDSGAKPDLCGENDKTALMTLLDLISGTFSDNELEDEEEIYIFNLLLASTTKINVKDYDGKSILFHTLDSDIGTEYFNITAFFKILEKDIDVNIIDNKGNNILISLLLYIEDYVEYDDVDFDIDYKRMIKHLVQKGIDTSHQNNQGFSAYSIAERLGNKEIVGLLRYDFPSIDEIIESVEEETVEKFTQKRRENYKVNFFTKLIKPKEIIVLLEELNKVELEFNNEHFPIVKDVIKKAISKNSKSLIQEIQNGNSENFLIYNMLRIFSGNLFETDKYPYRTFYGDGYDSGYYLLSFFDKSLDKLVELEKMEEEVAHEQKKIIRDNMNYLISKDLPFM